MQDPKQDDQSERKTLHVHGEFASPSSMQRMMQLPHGTVPPSPHVICSQRGRRRFHAARPMEKMTVDKSRGGTRKHGFPAIISRRGRSRLIPGNSWRLYPSYYRSTGDGGYCAGSPYIPEPWAPLFGNLLVADHAGNREYACGLQASNGSATSCISTKRIAGILVEPLSPRKARKARKIHPNIVHGRVPTTKAELRDRQVNFPPRIVTVPKKQKIRLLRGPM